MSLAHSSPNHIWLPSSIFPAQLKPLSWVLTLGWSDPWPRKAGGRWENMYSLCFREAGECLGQRRGSTEPGLPRVKPTSRKKKSSKHPGREPAKALL